MLHSKNSRSYKLEARSSVLFINSAHRENSYIILTHDAIRKQMKVVDRNVLAACDALLTKEKVALKKLKGIVVVTGPGQFSSLRTGITIANTLGFACSLPVAGVKLADTLDAMLNSGLQKLAKLKKFRPLGAEYGQEPNITVKVTSNR
ncbi:hypothetical protein HY620_01570 [Candidatus Uhrbacteria bacterium]|nr:hypothetical protein [Candidatus Uhrbacteria bacterium]